MEEMKSWSKQEPDRVITNIILQVRMDGWMGGWVDGGWMLRKFEKKALCEMSFRRDQIEACLQLTERSLGKGKGDC